MTFTVVFLVGTFLFCTYVAVAKPGDMAERLKYEAQQYYWGKDVRQNLPKAFTLYLQAAQLGDTEAQYIVGGMYAKGIGTQRDPREAFRWLYRAAKNGRSSPQSQKILGQDFLVGTVVPRNYTQSVRWYKMAADHGDHEAQNELAFLYYTGRGVQQNFQASFKWFEKAAKGGLPIAQYNVGIMWYTGNGVKTPDLITAYGWLSLAASNGYTRADTAIKYIETLLDPSELKEAQKKATALYNQISLEPKAK